METPRLFMLLLGCKPSGRNTEQHDIFFGIGNNIKELKPLIYAFWPEPEKIHLDAWREVTQVDGFNVGIGDVSQDAERTGGTRLFFINLGGYKKDEFEEFHYKMIVAAEDKGEAIKKAKETAFYRHTGFAGATSHIDDKFGVDVDDIYEIADILTQEVKQRYTISLSKSESIKEDEIHLGYFKLEKF